MFLLNIFRALSDGAIPATSIKRHLENLKGNTAFTYIFILSIVVFLLSVPTVLLLFISFCLENVLGPFLYGRSAGDKFSLFSIICERLAFPLVPGGSFCWIHRILG